jgi:DNA-binding LacI/PurR family transcriptional regulator
MKKANIYDVAKLAGVSHQTVSRVLNNHPSLMPATRLKVERAIKELEYRPNQAARQLVTSKSRMIGLLVTGSELNGPSSILNAMERKARLAGYSVISISILPKSRESWREGIEQLRRLDIDGVITIAAPKELVAEVESALPSAVLVVVDTEPSKKFDVVNIDNLAGGKMATEFLIELGHSKILHITGPVDAYEAKMRRLGYEQAMNKASLILEVVEGDWSIETGFTIGLTLSKIKRRPTAIFCANDHLALGIIKAFSQQDLLTPRDFSLIGFDDIPECAYFIPSLTTVKQDFDELGKLAINKMLAQLKERIIHEILVIKPKLIVRDSAQQLKIGKR